MQRNKLEKLKEEMFEVQTRVGSIPVFSAGPQDSGKYPGIILIHEIFGLNEHIKDLSRRFAVHGMRVYAPDLFVTAVDMPADRNDLNAMRAVWQSLDDALIIDELKALVSYILVSQEVIKDQIGTIGYCMGGAIAFMFAASAKEISFAIDYYGRIVYPELTKTKPAHPLDYAQGLNGPLLAIFAGRDELITSDHRELLKNKLASSGKQFEIKVFENAPHAFFNDTRPHYCPEEAQEAFELTLDFIDKQTARAKA